MFDPMTIPINPSAPLADPAPIPAAPTVPAPAPAPPPLPPAMLFKPKPAPKNEWTTAVVRKAQGIYPAEAQAKANQVANAKMPTPTGAWGSPQ